LLLPFALGIGALLNGVQQLVAHKNVLLWSMAALMTLIAVRQHEKLFYNGLVPNTLVSEADLKAIQWLAQTTTPGTVVQNRYGDAGLWIPAIAFRPITDPHLNPFVFDEFRAGALGLKAAYVFVGSRKVLGEPIAVGQFEARPDMYRKVYEADGAIIYAVTGQGTTSQAGEP
jgi:hypothetical protein